MKAAIYTRKSKFTGKGESIENQIIKCRQFITFKFEDIKDDDVEIFIDEGFSGKNEDRPCYQDMLNKIKNKEIDKVIIYQLNRLGRNARDIHNTMQMCDDIGCVIYSATEGFDSSTSFGRAVIGILASLAQLEREQLAERVKDNMYTLAKMGRWLGGQSPLGFDGVKEMYTDECCKQRYLTKLKPNNSELKSVKMIFDKYLELKSISQVAKWALTNNMRGKNGGNIDKTAINFILKNPVYVKSDKKVIEFLAREGYEVCGEPNGNGFLRYSKEEKIVAISNHKGIIDGALWINVQNILKSNLSKAPRLGKTNTALLTGILKCECGSPMRVSYGHKTSDGTTPFYYVCTMKTNSGGTRCNAKNLNGILIENKLIEYLKQYSTETLVQELKNIIQHFNDIDLNKEEKHYDSEIEKLTKIRDKLFDKLKLTDDDEISKMIMQEIQKENNQIKQLTLKKEKILNDKIDVSSTVSNIESIILKFQYFKDTFDKLKYEDKQNILRELISSIKLDGETLIVEFNVKKKLDNEINSLSSRLSCYDKSQFNLTRFCMADKKSRFFSGYE